MAEIKFSLQLLKEAIRRIPRRIKIIGILVVAFILFLVVSRRPTVPERERVVRVFPPEEGEEVGVLGPERTIRDFLVQKIERIESDSKDELKAQRDAIEKLQGDLKNLKEKNQVLEQKLTSLDENITKAVEKGMEAIDIKLRAILPSEEGAIPFPTGRLRVLKSGVEPSGKEVKPKEEPKKRYVYLPMGSFVKGTLLTGVYAPGNKENPLPVLISIDEAFYGPSMSRIPIKGCLAIGKAVADINARRAITQIVGISYVFPDGRTFEKEGNLGYLTGQDGTLGIPGKLVRRTGKELGGAFASGFLSGVAQALGEGETTTTIGALTGTATKAITGSALKYGGYSGLAAAAEKMSEYYAKQLEQIVTAIQVDMGQKVYLIMQKGVEIEELTPERVSIQRSSMLD